ncbi:FkbM family methyltransferase [bacterium]|nr:FkbM family methyltransferase [bacterium]
MKKLFDFVFYTDKTGRRLFLRCKIFGYEKVFKIGSLVRFHWKEAYISYFNRFNTEEKIKDLKKGMDGISCEYIDHFMKLVPYWGTFVRNLWTKYDLITDQKKKEFEKVFEQPFPKVLTIQPYLFSNIYGLSDLPVDVFRNINGKIIIDGGGWNGDTGLVFHRYFPESEIHIYEPISNNINKIKKILDIDNCNNKLIPIKKGLSNKICETEITYGVTELAQLTTIDNEYKDNDSKIGLIKLDTEGFETLIIEGAIDIIKRDKPVLAIAIYHTPEDFFELKTKLDNLNLGYKFMIRRSEMILPQADLVLIGYVK